MALAEKEEGTAGNRRKDHFEVYKDDRSEWRWRFRAKNGRITADSTASYKNKQDCIQGIGHLRLTVPMAPIEETLRRLGDPTGTGVGAP